MSQDAPPDSRSADCRWEKQANLAVHLFQLLFLVVLLFELDAPFLSAHNERQNQTFDMAQHVFHDGWSSVITPKLTSVRWGYENLHYSAVLQEVPFHGLIGWPLTLVTSHERAVVRLVSAAFAILSIQLLFWILRFWLPPVASAIGAAIWATSPLVFHFGQAPMPDILCTTGMLAAFWFAMRGKLPASSGCFLFAILAKLSVIAFGLPVLVALLVARKCASTASFLRLSLAWGWLPLCGIVLWLSVLYAFAPPTMYTLTEIMAERGRWNTLIHASFYRFLLGCIFPFGLGVLGFVGVLFALRTQSPKMDQRIKWALIGSNIFYLVFIVRKVAEPQYLLPMLAWCVAPVAFGLNFLAAKLRSSIAWRTALGAALMIHVLVAVAFTIDLKTSRVPNYPDIERAARLLPADARVIVAYPFYGASPGVWLQRNVLPVGAADGLPHACEAGSAAGFKYVLLLDIDSWHKDKSASGLAALGGRLLKTLRKEPPATAANLPGYADPAGPCRKYCDQNFSPLFVAPHVVLYSMTPVSAGALNP